MMLDLCFNYVKKHKDINHWVYQSDAICKLKNVQLDKEILLLLQKSRDSTATPTGRRDKYIVL